jgi:hypothetical protein
LRSENALQIARTAKPPAMIHRNGSPPSTSMMTVHATAKSVVKQIW